MVACERKFSHNQKLSALFSTRFTHFRYGVFHGSRTHHFIIKPDAVAKNVIGQIYSRFEGAGLKIVAARMLHLSQKNAEDFYGVHRERPFSKTS